MNASDRLIVAVDVPSRQEADLLCEQLADVVRWYKIGLELYCSEGPSMVADYVDAGRSVFIDLKLHDIPATVGRATRQLADLGAGLLTVHAAGGRAMMEAACEATRAGHTRSDRLHVLAVTTLTSLDQADLSSVGVELSVAELVVKRALLAADSGCDGVVASPHEAAAIRAVLPDNFLIVTPGIRPAGTSVGDQKRVMTPRNARLAGADRIVVGRPIRDADDPAAAAAGIIEELV